MSSSLPARGLRLHWRQFVILLVVNAFVGAMLGLERTLIPVLATTEFNLVALSISLTFIVSFGVVKACANLVTGRLADTLGRRTLLIVGWLFGLPVPWLMLYAPTWEWIVFANVLLGLQQGFSWSSAVIMKIDLVADNERGKATGLNEFTGYAAMAASTFLAGWFASAYAIRPTLFWGGIIISALGLLVSVVLVKETRQLVFDAIKPVAHTPFWSLFGLVTWRHQSLSSLSFAGLVNNLNDIVIWGLLPTLALTNALSIAEAAVIGSIYLGVWGVSQLLTGALSDMFGRKPLIVAGLVVQAVGISYFALSVQSWWWIVGAVVMGLGTGMVYPSLLAAVSDNAVPTWRATALGVYRFWRDIGYVMGALTGGMIADAFGITSAVWVIAVLTAFAAVVVALRLQKTAMPA
ncbi:MAG: MFS transporter [Roseiflexaceae bacterium]